MRWIYWIFLASVLPMVLGCHSAEEEGRRRKKRQAPTSTELAQTLRLRDYFVDCLRREAGDIWRWESVIDVVILDTQWYLNSANGSNCRSGTSEDSAACWIERLSQLLRDTSRLSGPTRRCIEEYAVNITGTLDPPTLRRGKRQATTEDPDEMCTDFFPNSPAVRAFTFCNDQRVDLLPGRREVDFPSVSQFMAEDVVCGSELGDCNQAGQETISDNDPSVPTWPYLFEAVTRRGSPVRQSVVACNNRVFPLESDNPAECQPWGQWSACICNNGGRRTRRRSCAQGVNAERSQSERCTRDSDCVQSVSELLLRIFLIQRIGSLPDGFRVGY